MSLSGFEGLPTTRTFEEGLVASLSDVDYVFDIAADQLSAAARHSILIAALNVLLGAGAAWKIPAARSELEAAVSASAPGGSILWGADASIETRRAALVNGAAAHHFAFDDTADILLGHPGVVLVPALLAAAQDEIDYATFLSAYASGYEMMAFLAGQINPEHYLSGWHATSTLGVMGASLAIAKSRKLNELGCARALGIAATLVCGLRTNVAFGLRRWHAGIAASHAVDAVQFAEMGVEPNPLSIDGPLGLIRTLNGGRAGKYPARLSQPSLNGTSSLNLKEYPGCGAIAPAVGALLHLLSQARLEAESIASVHVRAAPLVHKVVTFEWPDRLSQAGFSLAFPLALAIEFGRVDPWHFNEATLSSESLRRIGKRIHIEADASLGPTKYESEVRITTCDGTIMSARRPGVGGRAAATYSSAEIVDRWCALWPAEERHALLGAAKDFVAMSVPFTQGYSALVAALRATAIKDFPRTNRPKPF